MWKEAQHYQLPEKLKWDYFKLLMIAVASTVFKKTEQTENNKYCSLALTMWKTWSIIVCYICDFANK